MIAAAVYALCALTSSIVAALLYRQSRARNSPLLFWSVIGFTGLAANNILVYVDLGMFPNVDLVLARTLAGTIGMTAMLYGLIRSTGS
jgi:hypothetical protein